MRSAALVVAFLSGVQAQAFPYGPPLPVEFGATHVADNSDVVKWTCPNLTFADIDILDFDPVTKNIPEIRLHLRNCKFVKNGPGGLIGLIVSIVQGLILITLGPAIAIYGPTFRRFTSLVQAVVISSYILLINSIISVDALSAFFVFERTITLIISVLTVTYMSSKSPGLHANTQHLPTASHYPRAPASSICPSHIPALTVSAPLTGGRAKAAGFALGQLIGTPLFGFIAQQLYEPVCGCSGLGKKSTYFPNGEPLGCDLFATDFQR